MCEPTETAQPFGDETQAVIAWRNVLSFVSVSLTSRSKINPFVGIDPIKLIVSLLNVVQCGRWSERRWVGVGGVMRIEFLRTAWSAVKDILQTRQEPHAARSFSKWEILFFKGQRELATCCPAWRTL